MDGAKHEIDGVKASCSVGVCFASLRQNMLLLLSSSLSYSSRSTTMQNLEVLASKRERHTDCYEMDAKHENNGLNHMRDGVNHERWNK